MNNKGADQTAEYAGWSAPLLFANPGGQVFSRGGPFYKPYCLCICEAKSLARLSGSTGLNTIFERKIVNIFLLIIFLNIFFGCSKEPSR